jgi:hypothetical protein
MKQGIKGQDTVIQVIKGGSVEKSLTSVKDFSIQFDISILSTGYIGETTERKDEVFRGVSGKITVDWTDPNIVDFVDSLVKRARRELPYFSVNIMSTITDANGDAKRIIIPDAFFENPDANMTGRDAYMETTLTFQASEYTIL